MSVSLSARKYSPNSRSPGIRTMSQAQSIQFVTSNQLNNSTSKQMYSFPKSPRKSIDCARRTTYCHAYYDLESSVSMTKLNLKKTPGFGIGKKSSQKEISMEHKFSPSPGSHNIASFVDKNQSHGKGYSFGASNEVYAKVYNEAAPEKKGWTDPGLYTIKSFADNVKSGRKRIFFGGRTHSRAEERDEKLPGPGAYNDNDYEGINKIGVYTNTKHKNSLAPNFLKGKRKTFAEEAQFKAIKSKVPGPGAYKD